MAVFVAGGRWAWDRGHDNGADQLIAFQAQMGRARDYTPDAGVVVDQRFGSDYVQVDVGVNTYADGQTFGGVDNRLESASAAPFTKAMLGMSFTITGHGTRTITEVISATQIRYSGPVLAAATGRRFTQPLGLSLLTDGVVNGNTLTSASAPFTAAMEDEIVSLQTVGARKIDTFTSATEVIVDGAAMAYQEDVPFILPVVAAAADRQLMAGAQIIDSHRSPEANTALVMRWRLGLR